MWDPVVSIAEFYTGTTVRDISSSGLQQYFCNDIRSLRGEAGSGVFQVEFDLVGDAE